MFSLSLGCIEAIVTLGGNATIGAIQKMNIVATRGQVERCLKNLQAEGYVTYQDEKYGRTGRKVWMLTDRCVTNVFGVANKIDQAVSAEGAA